MKSLGQLGFGLIKVFLFLVVLGGVSLVFISGYQYLSSSRYFRITDIVTTGIDESLRNELIKISGIKENETLLSIDLAVAKRNMERHPWIKSVSLRKKYPHSLCIDGEKNKVMAIVALGEMRYMNKNGDIFKNVEKNDCNDFPVITGLSSEDMNERENLKRAVSLIQTFSSDDSLLSKEELSEVHIEENGGLSIYFSKFPFKIFFGRDDFAGKFRALKEIVKYLKGAQQLHQAQSINLGCDEVIVAYL